METVTNKQGGIWEAAASLQLIIKDKQIYMVLALYRC